MHYLTPILSLSALPLLFNTAAVALAINCRGSDLCPRAYFNDTSPEPIVQAPRGIIWTDADSSSTTYSNGDDIGALRERQDQTPGPSSDLGPIAKLELEQNVGLME